ncbi:peptidoglycan-binding protein [Paracoccus caeni]|uniref:Peptidoglycan-binding protein n=1 Tax=Paracoccus caeni TaxID=657651 RepID=A0A934VU28_9RHOB|nr:peptidoglycan-binding protein [Paracoccus caeni]MBK4215371.1 peptidoglycan-binding protein [Paracoccus caeni]
MGLSRTIAFSELVIDRRRINGDLIGARNVTMLTLIGNPRGNYDQECRSPTNRAILAQTVSRDVGPFSVTGLKPAVETLERILAQVKREERAVYDVLGHVGMMCCRYVRGSRSAISNHSWGTAIDLTLEGRLDSRGDNRTQEGLLKLRPIFNEHGFFWGAAFTTEDSMHFEASDQLIRRWADDGLLNGTPSGTVGLIDFGDRGSAVEDLQKKLNLLLGLDLDVDGIFGPATRAAVMEFQRSNGLVVDGIVGPKTRERLEA